MLQHQQQINQTSILETRLFAKQTIVKNYIVFLSKKLDIQELEQLMAQISLILGQNI